MHSLKYLNQIATYLKVSSGKIMFSDDLQPVRTHESITTTGFINIIISLLNQRKSIDLTAEEEAELYQWLEYAIVYAVHHDVSHNINQILIELNGVLATRTYLVGNVLTVADIILYYILLNTMENLSYVDKEKYVNVSRWFDNLQQDPEIRQNNRIVDFSTGFLSGFVPIVIGSCKSC